MNRRAFMKSGALALVTVGLSPSFLRRTVFAGELLSGNALKGGRGKTLICLFQRGAADGLNVLVPHGDASYYAHRPAIAIPRRPALHPQATRPRKTVPVAVFFPQAFFHKRPIQSPCPSSR